MHNTLFSLKGRVALVTGGSKGLGKAMARGFVEAGADVFISSRHQSELETAAAEVASGWESRVAWAVSDHVRSLGLEALPVQKVAAPAYMAIAPPSTWISEPVM